MFRVTDQYFWNFVFLVFFVVLVVLLSIILHTEARIPLQELSVIDYTLLTLATWRLTRLFVSDTITRFIREQFFDVKKVGKGYVLEKARSGPRRTLADLFSCSWCFSIFAATVVTFFYLLTSYAMYPIIILALSAVATFFQLISNLMMNAFEKPHIKKTEE
jgi:hypothetical protein